MSVEKSLALYFYPPAREVRDMNIFFSRTPLLRLSILVVLLSGCEMAPSPRADEAPSASQKVVAELNPSVAQQSIPSPQQSMARLMRELEGKPPLPSDTREGSSSSEDTAEGVRSANEFPTGDAEERSSAGGCEHPTLPTWVRQRSPLAGVGGPSTSREEAEAHAKVDVVKQLELSITGEDIFVEQESTGGEFQYDVRSKVVERVNIRLTGLGIKTVFQDPCDHQFYALAILDRSAAENRWRTDLSALDSQADAFRNHIATYTQKGEAFSLLLAQYRLMEVAETGSQLERRLAYLTGSQLQGPSRAGAVKQSLNAYESLLGSLQVKTSGDGQQAVNGPALPNPLMVQVLAGDTPVPRVPVEFTVTQGRIDVPHTAWTDAQGKAQVVARYSVEIEEPARIEARVLLDQVTHEYPEALKQQVLKRSPQFTARFQVLPPVYHLLTHSQQLVSEGDTLHSRIQTAHKEGDVFLLMGALSELHAVQTEWDQVMERLRDRHPASAESAKSPGDAEDTLHDLERLISSFEFRVVKGNEQHAVLGRPLEDSLKAQLVVNMAGKEVPVSQVPVMFEFDQGKGDVDTHVSTSLDGHALAIVHRVEPAGGKNGTEAIVVARLDVTNLGQSLSATFRERLHNHLHEQVLRFRIIPPRGCVSLSPFDAPLYELACDLVRQVNSSVGKPTIVRGFVERGSRQRHPLSDRIEEALVAGLTLTQQLQVLQLADSGSASTSHRGEVEVSGVYEQYGDGLLVKAALTRLNDHGTEAASETTIPRDALPKTGLNSVTRPSSSHTTIELVPNHSQFTTHNEWMTAFWQHDNPQASFQTWIKPKEPNYREGEKASFLFKTERDCYLWVFNIGASGTGAVLLPNKYRPDAQQTLIRASDGWVPVPGPADNFALPIGPPFGIERIKTICTTRPVSILSNHVFQNLQSQLPLFLFSEVDHRYRDVGVAPTGPVALKSEEWSEAHTKVVTLPKGQHTTRGMRGLRGLGLDQKK